jgi:hypothetical protein
MDILRVLLLFAPSLVLAQSTGTILGSVSDSSGAVVPGATISVDSLSTSQHWQVTSDAAGRFNFPHLPVVDYKLGATHPGFRQFLSVGIHLDSDQTRAANIGLELGLANDSITVSGTVGLVETVGGTFKEVVDEFRAESFNSLNHANPGNPVANIGAATVGRILSASDPRILQFALKLVY